MYPNEYTRAEYHARHKELEFEELRNLITCRIVLRQLLDVVSSGRSPEIGLVELASEACEAAEANRDEARHMIRATITDATPCKLLVDGAWV